MSNVLLIPLLIVGPLLAYVAVLMMPRWFFRSLHGHRMWRLRDAVVDDVLIGNLPRDHNAVKQLIRSMDIVLRERHITLLDVYVVKWASRGLDPVVRKAKQEQGFRCSLEGLTSDERQRVEAYRARFVTLLSGSALLGSWFGIAHIVPFMPAGLAIAMREAGAATRDGIAHRLRGQDVRFGHELWVSAREATDLAANKTRVGQDAAVFAVRHDVSYDTVSHDHPFASSRP